MKKLVITFLLFPFLSSSIVAKDRTLKTEKDGFEWYKTAETGNYGAEDANGREIVPMEYNLISYRTNGEFFKVTKGKNEGIFDKSGKCLIDTGRGYSKIVRHDVDGVIWFSVEKNGMVGACDAEGIEVVAPEYEDVLFTNNAFFRVKDGEFLPIDAKPSTPAVAVKDNLAANDKKPVNEKKSENEKKPANEIKPSNDIKPADDKAVIAENTVKNTVKDSNAAENTGKKKSDDVKRKASQNSRKANIKDFAPQDKPQKKKLLKYQWAMKDVPTLRLPDDYYGLGGFHDGVAVVEDVDNYDNKLYGIINSAGELIVPYKYKTLKNFRDGIAIAETEEGFGIINTSGNIIVPFIYDEIEPNDKIPSAYILKKGLSKKLFYDGKLIRPDIDAHSIDFYSFPIVKIYPAIGDMHYINVLTGQNFEKSAYQIGGVVISDGILYSPEGPQIDIEKESVSSKGVVPYSEDNRYGYKNSMTGEIITKPIYRIDSPGNIWIKDTQIAKRDDSEGYVIINNEGEEIAFEGGKSIRTVLDSGGDYLITIDSDGNFGLHDREGHVILDNQYNLYVNNAEDLGEDWFRFASDDITGIVNARTGYGINGYAMDGEINEGISVLYDRNTGKSYYVDLVKQCQIGGIYDHADPFNEGLGRVNHKQFIDRNGTVVLDLEEFDEVGKSFSEGVLPVFLRGEDYDYTRGYIYNPLGHGNYVYNQRGATREGMRKWLTEADELYNKKQYARAKDLYYRAMINDPRNLGVVVNYGNCLYELGYLEDALATYDIAKDIDPDSELVKKNYAIIQNRIQEVKNQNATSNNNSGGGFWDAINNFASIFVQAMGGSAPDFSANADYGSGGSYNDDSYSGSSSSGGADASFYTSQYKRWESNAESNFNSLTLLGSKHKNKKGDISGSNSGSFNSQTYVGLKQNLRNAQRQMKNIRAQARSKGVNIPQSKWETATVSY